MTPSGLSKPIWRWKSAIWCILGIGLTYLVYRCFLEDQLQSGSYGCEMSYMWPTYHPVEWPDNPSKKYSLYLYREQGWDRDDKPSGHPVIFIPGNAGSFKQVRSIASSASRQYYTENGRIAHGMEDKTSLDFFAVDYNEDFSAFHAPTLRDQAHFLASSVRHVIRQYEHVPAARRPTKVTLLGHSMGGVVARLAMDDLPNLIDVIMTMSTPHALPPVSLSQDMDTIYDTLAAHNYNTSAPLLFSICGGTADTQIASDTCVIPPNSITKDDGFTIFTTGMPGAWTGVEHQTMVWCHQIRWRVARTLLGMTSAASRREKLAVAEDRLLGINPVTAHKLGGGVQRIPVTTPSMSLRIAGGYDASSPIRWCQDELDCRLVKTNMTILPAPNNAEAPFPLPGEGNRPDEKDTVIDMELPSATGHLEIQTSDQQRITHGAHHKYELTSKFWSAADSDDTGIHLNIRFSKASTSSLVVHRLNLEFGDCKGRRPTVRYVVNPSGDRNTLHEARFYPNVPDTVYLHAHSGSSPYLPSVSSGFDVDIYQDRLCPVRRASLSIDWKSSLAKMVTRYRMAALAWIIGWVTILVSRCIKLMEQSGSFSAVGEVIERSAYPLSIVVTLQVITVSSGSAIMGWPSWYLGIDHVELVPFSFVLIVWSFGVVNLIWKLIELALWISKFVPISKRITHVPTPISLWSITTTAGPLLTAVHFLIPHQMAFVILLLVLLATLVSEDPSSSRYNLLSMLSLLLIVLIPFNAPVLAVWGRNIWADWRNPFPGDWDTIRILPLLALVWLCASGRPIKPRPNLLTAIKWTSLIIGLATFAFGGRRTYIIPPMVDIMYIELACLFI